MARARYRSTGLATSTDLVNWTKDADNPLFDGGRFCVSPFRRGDYYYLLVPHYTSGASKSNIELYGDSNPTFYRTDREYLDIVIPYGVSGWDSAKLDTAMVLTDNIARSTFSASGNQLWAYYGGCQKTNWATGMTIETDIDSALNPNNNYATTPLDYWIQKQASAISNWSKYRGNPILSPTGNEDLTAWGSVLKVDSTYYYYYTYHDANDRYQIGRASSTDGKSWTKDIADNPVFMKGASGKFDDAGTWLPLVWVEDRTWHMLYSGTRDAICLTNNAIGYATSSDGVSWVRQNSGNAVLSGTTGKWDENHAEAGGIIKVGSTYYLFYSTFAVKGWWDRLWQRSSVRLGVFVRLHWPFRLV